MLPKILARQLPCFIYAALSPGVVIDGVVSLLGSFGSY
jgi:hypothetical protein